MKDNSLKKDIRLCEAYARKTPKTIKEALAFETDDNVIAADEIDNEVENTNEPEQKPNVQTSKLNVEEFVNDIRMKALKGMAELADNPESSEYQILKKIWQICDKKPEEQRAQEPIK